LARFGKFSKLSVNDCSLVSLRLDTDRPVGVFAACVGVWLGDGVATVGVLLPGVRCDGLGVYEALSAWSVLVRMPSFLLARVCAAGDRNCRRSVFDEPNFGDGLETHAFTYQLQLEMNQKYHYAISRHMAGSS